MQVRINETNIASIKEMAVAETRSIPFITNQLLEHALNVRKPESLAQRIQRISGGYVKRNTKKGRKP